MMIPISYMSMKSKMLMGCMVVVAVVLFAIQWNSKHNAEVCINQMRQWTAAAESYCLAEHHGPAERIRLEVLATYVKNGMKQAICPSGGKPYAAFTVANGPVCPNGHSMEPGMTRQFRAPTESKLAGVYEAAGWSNLIDKAGHTEPPQAESVISILKGAQIMVNLRDLSLEDSVASIESQVNTNQNPVYMIKIRVEGVPKSVSSAATSNDGVQHTGGDIHTDGYSMLKGLVSLFGLRMSIDENSRTVTIRREPNSP